jgi:hypothetical protein
MNKEQQKALLQLEQIIELELQEMRKFLPSRFTRLQNAINTLQATSASLSLETVEDLSDNDYNAFITSAFLATLLKDLPPYVSNKQTAQE